MQGIKAYTDRLASIEKTMDHEDIIEKVLTGLDYEQYKSGIDVLNARDTPIYFEELQEKLITKEVTASLKPATSMFSAFVNVAQHKTMPLSTPSWPTRVSNDTTSRQQRPYLGKYQWCHEQGHSLSHCLTFEGPFPTIHVPTSVYNKPVKNGSSSSVQAPQEHVTTNSTH